MNTTFFVMVRELTERTVQVDAATLEHILSKNKFCFSRNIQFIIVVLLQNSFDKLFQSSEFACSEYTYAITMIRENKLTEQLI